MKFIEPLDMIYENIKNKINMHFMFCIMPGILCFDTSGFYSPYYDIVRIIEEEKKTPQFYSEAQTEQKHAIWCRCWC